MEKITSIEKYISFIMRLKKERAEQELHSYQWFFRGQKDSTWSIIPNIFREEKLQNEYAIIQNAVRQNPFEFRTLTEFETLTKLQHYGLGTRLLDITLNPLVALYFATEPAVTYERGKDKRYKQVEKDGVIYYNHVPWHSENELSTRIAMVIPFIDFEQQYTVDSLLNHLLVSKVISEEEYGSLQKDNYKLFIEYIQDNYFVVSTHSNERLTRQSGAFILPTAIKINTDEIELKDKRVEKTYQDLTSEFEGNYLIVPSKYKEQIREELDFLNINEATMFPELEHQMTYIQKKNIVVSGKVSQFQEYKPEILADATVEEYNDAVPNITVIIDSVIPEIPPLVKKELTDIITGEIDYIDWKSKYQIRSKIRLHISKCLQKQYSAILSKEYANQILELLLKPTGKYVREG